MADTPSLFPSNDHYLALLNDLKQQVRAAQVKAALAVNRELVLLYWQMGSAIAQRQQQEGWGSKVIQRLAQDLKREFPDMKGFSRSNLMYMRAFASAWPDLQIVQGVLGQIPWYHNLALLDKLNDEEERLWYAHKTVENGWSRNVLVMQIESGLYRRLGGAVTNFDRVLPSPQSDLAQSLIKDPYNFDFLTLSERVQERDLENALTHHIRDFLLELGLGFSFLGSQYPITVSNKEYRIDLLFYHVHLHCYVVIDLKMGEFEPQHSGQMSFYVAAVDNLMRTERDDPTIGIILCKTKDRTTVEYALQGNQQPIGVSSYRLRDSLPTDLQDQLPTAEQLEMGLETAMQELESESNG
jgi:predicted nuclease of restriction endonuclease-like (RecB) superfamily